MRKLLVLALLSAAPIAAQTVNTNQIRWPQPSCGNPFYAYSPASNICEAVAPLINPAGGQNNYAPLDQPSFTGPTTSTVNSFTNYSYNANQLSTGTNGTGIGMFRGLAPNLVVGGNTGFLFGTTVTNGNNTILQFRNHGLDSPLNSTWFGIGDIGSTIKGICTNATGNTGIGYTNIDDCPTGSALTVNGDAYATTMHSGGPGSAYIVCTPANGLCGGGGGGGGVSSVNSADANLSVANSTTAPVLTVVAAPKLTTARNINGVAFDGTADITVAAAAGTLTGSALAGGVGTASLNSITPASGSFRLNLNSNTNIFAIRNNALGQDVSYFTALGGANFSSTVISAGTELTGTGTATSSANFPSNIMQWDYNYWSGSASAAGTVTSQATLAAGANPTVTLNFAKPAGSSGTFQLAVAGSPVCTLANPCGGGGGGGVTSVTSADANATVATATTTPVITIVSAPKLQTARTINGVSFDGTANITTTSAPSGSASGDLSGSYPSPAVVKINGVSMAGLSTGILKNTTSTGAPSIAAAADIISTLGFNPAPAYSLPDSANLLAWYKFAETSGSVLSDYSGHSNNGTIVSAPTRNGIGYYFATGSEQINFSNTLNSGNTYHFVVNIPPVPRGFANPSAIKYPSFLSSSNTSGTNSLEINGIAPYASQEPGVFGMAALNASGTFMVQATDFWVGTHVISLVCPASGQGLFYLDGQPSYSYLGTSLNCNNIQTAGNFLLGPSAHNSSLNPGGVTFYEMAVHSDAQSAATVLVEAGILSADAAARGASFLPPSYSIPAPSVFFAGDSITCGSGIAPLSTGCDPSNPGGVSASAYPGYVATHTSKTYSAYNFGVPSAQVQQQIVAAPYFYTPLCKTSVGQSIGSLFEGTNNFNTPGNTASRISDLQGSWVSIMKSAGCRTMLMSMISRGSTDNQGNNYDSDKNALNSVMRSAAYGQGAEMLIDLGSDPLLGADGAYSNLTYFNSDQIHPTASGQTEIGMAAACGVNALDGSTPQNMNQVPITATSGTLSCSQNGENFNSVGGSINWTMRSAMWLTNQSVRYCNATASGANTVTLTAPSDFAFNNVTGSTTVTIAAGMCANFKAKFNGNTSTPGNYWQTLGSSSAGGSGGGTVTNVSGTTANGFAVSTTSPTTTPVISVAADGTHYLPTTTDQTNWNAKQGAISLTTTGTSGAATLTGTTLNIPNYAGASGLSGMTVGQVPIAATATTVTSSMPLAGSGTGIVTGPTTSVSGNIPSYSTTTGQTQDSGVATTNLGLLSGAQTFSGLKTFSAGFAATASSTFGNLLKLSLSTNSNSFIQFGTAFNVNGSNSLSLSTTSGTVGVSPVGTNTTTFSNTGTTSTVPITLNHLVGAGTAPTIAAGAAAGTTPTVALVTGTDLSGYITVTTGTTPTASATIATVTFGAAYGAAPKCEAWPSNVATQALTGIAGAQILRAGITTTNFALTQGATALAASTAYEWGYQCVQ